MNIKDKRLFLLDMDGTIYLGDRLFKGAKAFFQHINSIGARYMFLSNNSSKGVKEYVKKLRGMGIEARPEDFMTSLQATAHYLLSTDKKRVIYGCGTDAMRSELAGFGLDVRDKPCEETNCIVIGFDTQLTFEKLEYACRVIDRGAEYIATHPDMVCPMDGINVPDCGAVCEMLYTATGKRPKVIGKPDPLMAKMAMEAAGVTSDKALFIGDRLNTDIACGINAGMDTVLVLSGVSTREQAEQGEIKPSLICRDIEQLLYLMRGISV